jgi:steroid delta-isomerase-like uncharacterized protein
MSTEQNRAVARRFVDDVLNKEADPDPLFAETLVFHFPGAPAPLDRQGWKQSYAPFTAAFPDVHTTIDDMIAEGDQVVARLTTRGTHRGTFQGIPATGRQVAFPSIAIWRIVSGKIVEHWVILDTLGLLQQLGALPTPQPSAV